MKQVNKKYTAIYFLMFLFLLAGCSPEEEVVVPVPEISGIESEYTVLQGDELEFSPVVTNGDDASYRWTVDGKEVANGAEYTFNALRPGSYEIILMVTNLGGTTEKKISIKVKAEVIRVETATHTLLSLETPAYLDDEAEIQWVATSASSELYRLSYADTSSPLFVAAKEGEYRLKDL